MKTMLLLAVFLLISAIVNADDNSYAIAAYSALSTETVIVYGPTESCDAASLANLRKAIQPTIAPSLAEIGYACASHNQILRLNLAPPICEIESSDTTSVPVWIYVCYSGIVDRLVRPPPPPPTEAELEQQREAKEAAQAAQRQAAGLAAERTAERMAWQRRAVDWVYQRERAICLQKLRAHLSPGQDDPEPLCDRAARNKAAGNPTMDVFQYCTYMRSTGQPESAIHAACEEAPSDTAPAPQSSPPAAVPSSGSAASAAPTNPAAVERCTEYLRSQHIVGQTDPVIAAACAKQTQ